MLHDLERLEDVRHKCKKCNDIWTHRPSSYCPGVSYYGWHSSPPYLQTYSQLRAKHLKPRDRYQHDGCIVCHREWVWLYDERQAIPRRQCSDLQRQVLATARQRQREKYTCKHCGAVPTCLADLKYNFGRGGCNDCLERLQWEAEQDEEEWRRINDSNEAILWARYILERNDWCVLDTETTSLTGFVVDLAIVAPDGTTLFNSLINPECEVTSGAKAVHGITDEELTAAPRLLDVWQEIQTALAGRSLILAYNVAFDEAVMIRSAQRYQLPELTQKWDCIMEWYAQYFGEWSRYHGNYKWQPLYGGHRALGDALAALDVLKTMAYASLSDASDANDEEPTI